MKIRINKFLVMLLAAAMLPGNTLPHVQASVSSGNAIETSISENDVSDNGVSDNDASGNEMPMTFKLTTQDNSEPEWHELSQQTVAVWDRTDIVLTSSKEYKNPYLDVEVEAVFTHTDGTEIKLSGFWNGDNEWRVRFAPTKIGIWNYVITSNKASDIAAGEYTGLHYVKGSVNAVENTGDSAIDKHGFIEFSENGRYFQHADGTPFYWLGDTNWQAPNYVSITQCNYPGCDCGNQFKHEVDNRIEKGFNVYQTYFDSAESDGGGQRKTTSEPSIWQAVVKNVQSKASTSNSTYTADASHDNSEMTYWCAAGSIKDKGEQWIAYDLGSKEKFNLIEMKLYSIGSVFDLEVYGSDDASAWAAAAENTGWTKIHTETPTPDANKWVKLSFDEAEYQYIKILFKACAATTAWPAIYETKLLYSVDKDENLLKSDASYQSSSVNFSCNASKAIDGDLSSTSYWSAAARAPQWIAYDLGAEKTFNHIELQLKNDKVNEDVNVEIYGTNDDVVWSGNGEWKKIHAEKATTDASARLYLEFDEAEYRYIKILFTENFPGGWPQIWEVEVYNYSQANSEASEEPTNLLGNAGAYDLINPETFTNKIDKMFDYLADNGMVIALGYGLHISTPTNMGDEALENISRYLTARYASYPVVWITGQEVNGTTIDSWIKSAEVVDEWDGYDHPQGTHLYVPTDSDNIDELDSKDWHEWWAVQAGHNSYPRKEYYQGFWDTGKLFLETESFYEDIALNNNEYERSRIGAWKANLCGSYGFTYGAVGIWANSYSTAGNTGWASNFNYEPWYMGLDKEGSYEMTYLKNFFEYVEFHTLIPRFNDSAYSDFTVENKLVSSNDDGSTYIGYFFNSNTSTGELRGLNASNEYTARWYNPLTGKFIDIENVEVTAEGKYIIPEKPTTADWALLVTCKDLGAYETEEAYEEKTVIDEVKEVNLALEVDAICSSFTESPWYATSSNDGDTTTYWCASNGTYPQWVAYDLGTTQLFDRVKLTHVGKLTADVSFIVYGSNVDSAWENASDATNWTVIKELSYAEFDGTIAFDEVEYRYVKIEYTCSGTAGTWATATEVEIYKHIDKELPELPEYLGQVQTPTINCVGGAIYSADGVLTDTKENLVDKDYDTYWEPFSPAGTQTIIMDLKNQLNLTGIIVTLGEGSYLPEYRVEASNDGSDWTILADATLRSVQYTIDSESPKMFEELSGEYRYVKLFWLGAPNNYSIKTIAEIELYAYEEADKALLEDEIEKAEAIVLDDYVDGAAKDVFKTALSEAKAVYDKADATQAEVDEAKETLSESVKLLEKKTNDTTTTPSGGETNADNNSNNTTTGTNGENSSTTGNSTNAENTTTGTNGENSSTTGNSTNAENTTTVGNPETGDTNNVIVWIVGLFAAMGIVGVLILKREKERADQA